LNSTRAFAVVALGVLAVVPACDDPVRPDPPGLPPQIETLGSYSFSSTGLTNNDVFALLAVSNGELWIGSASGIAKFPDLNATTRDADSYVSELTGLPNSKVRVMAEYNGKVYVGTWGGGLGVYDVAGDTWTQIQQKTNGLRNNSIADIEVSATEDRIYFATNDGVSIYNPTAQTFTSVITNPPLLDKLVSSIEVVDFSGTIIRWYGPRVEIRLTPAQIPSHGISVTRTPGTSYTYTSANSGIAEPNVNDIVYDSDRQSYWVAYGSKGIAEVSLTQKTWTTDTMVQGLPSNTVYSITRANGILWAATLNGLAKRVGEHEWQGYNRGGGLQADRVRALYSPDGDRLYVGFVDGGAARIQTH
jgi:ligand-binding sensor domain-containing protein